MAVCTAGELLSTCLLLLVVVVVVVVSSSRLRALCFELPSAWSVYCFREDTRASDSVHDLHERNGGSNRERARAPHRHTAHRVMIAEIADRVASSRFSDTAGNLIRTGYKKEQANWLDFYISLSESKNSWSGIGNCKCIRMLDTSICNKLHKCLWSYLFPWSDGNII
ncbi:hypothetical protein ALC60_01987 [Trachymyrmex zeteki]|uniref:Uncharacterized protein n=1 Tax=Mycetomoellerius zeteki TaxID=64791 RepID=A0A151XFB6_9HYME|nr:hypothetical protein ALC60_01987 [Trachymyrmex zeteki]